LKKYYVVNDKYVCHFISSKKCVKKPVSRVLLHLLPPPEEDESGEALHKVLLGQLDLLRRIHLTIINIFVYCRSDMGTLSLLSLAGWQGVNDSTAFLESEGEVKRSVAIPN
jgi:hypothetical protein